MKYSYQWLKEYIQKLPSVPVLVDWLNMHAFEVESVEKKGNDHILDIKLLNRTSDVGGHIGMAHEIAAVLNTESKAHSQQLLDFMKFKHEHPDQLIRELLRDNKKSIAKLQTFGVSVQDPEACPRYIAYQIDNIIVGASPTWLKKHLSQLNVNSINLFVDLANFVMLKIGQPMHVFDTDKIDSKEIFVRYAKKGERMTTLDGVECALDPSMLVIADHTGALAVAGVKGGDRAAVTKSTKNIIIESANFNSASVRRTSRMLKISTDASQRFAQGLDPNLAEYGMGLLVRWVLEYGGKDAEPRGFVDVYPKPQYPRKIVLRPEKIEKMLGMKVSTKQLIDVLRRLEFKIKINADSFMVEVPTMRTDLTIEEDLVEEVGRIIGYDNIESKPFVETFPLPEHNINAIWQDKIKNTLSVAGFAELDSYDFIGNDDIERFGEADKKHWELENPIRPEFAYLRRSLAPTLTKQVANYFESYDNLRFFEIGKVFLPELMKPARNASKLDPAGAQIDMLGGAIWSSSKATEKNAENFYVAKGVLTSLFESAGIDDVWFDDAGVDGYSYLHPFRSAIIKSGDHVLGYIGALHPQVAHAYGIKKGETVLFEIDVTKFVALAEEEIEYREPSKYPSVVRDISLVVPQNTRVVDVEDIIENTGGKLLCDTDLFDLYEGENIDADKRSMAFHLVFQSGERTLHDDDVHKVMKKIVDACESKDWEVRK